MNMICTAPRNKFRHFTLKLDRSGCERDTISGPLSPRFTDDTDADTLPVPERFLRAPAHDGKDSHHLLQYADYLGLLSCWTTPVISLLLLGKAPKILSSAAYGKAL